MYTIVQVMGFVKEMIVSNYSEVNGECERKRDHFKSRILCEMTLQRVEMTSARG